MTSTHCTSTGQLKLNYYKKRCYITIQVLLCMLHTPECHFKIKTIKHKNDHVNS